MPHPPQLFGSVAVFTQLVPHLVVPDAQTQLPGPEVVLQVSGDAHVPQFAVGQFVPSEIDPHLLVPQAAVLHPPHVPGLPVHVPAPEAHVPQFCITPQSSTNEPHVALSEAHVFFAVHEQVPAAPLQVCGAVQLPQLGVLPQVSVNEPHVYPCEAQLSVALHEHVPAPLAPAAHVSGAVQLPQFCVTLHESTNDPQVAPSDLHVVVAVHPQVPGPPLVLLHTVGAVHVPHDTVPPHPSGALPHVLPPHGLAVGTQMHAPLALQCDPAAQACPQVPQLLSSLLRVKHAPLQEVVPAAQERVHALPTHAALPVAAPPVGPGHDLQTPPPIPVPHSVAVWVVVTQPWLSQQPLAHVVPLHAEHAPLWQTRPVPHAWPSWTATGFVHCTPAEQA